MALGAVIVYIGKLAWQRWGAKSSRISEDLCVKNQEICRAKMLAEFFTFKLDIKNSLTSQNTKFQLGDDNFAALGVRLDRTNALLSAILSVEMERCRTSKDVDCDELTAILVRQGIEVGSLNMRKRETREGGEASR
jgi:hypothetical protein